MPARPGPTSQEGYPSSSPSTDTHNDPFNAQGRRYYDNESDNADYGRRDTYASDSSNPGLHDPNFYDQNGNYDPYRKLECRVTLCTLVSLCLLKLPKTQIQTLMSMASDMHPLQSR